MKSTGDGVLVEFPSAHDAVDWARQVQRQVITTQVEHDNESATITLRVAVHLGDVITTEFDVFGDGVNVAARLQQHSVPGGVILSEAFYNLVPGPFERHRDLGFLQLRNFEKPIRAYSLDPEASGSLDPEANEREGSRHHRPSVAVLPFNNLSGDPQQEYFSDGITEDLQLSCRGSANSWSSREILPSIQGKGGRYSAGRAGTGRTLRTGGQLRRSGDRVRIAAQVIDAMTGARLWAERYDREVHDVFAVQDEVVRMIVAILAVHVNRAEIERVLLKLPAAWEAYECYLRGAEAWPYIRTDARKRRSMKHGVCSNNPWRSTRITHAPLPCCPGFT